MHRTFQLALALAVGGAIPAAAQGWIEVRQPVPSPRPVPIGGPVVRVSSEVRISIDGRIARVEVEERFRNAGRYRRGHLPLSASGRGGVQRILPLDGRPGNARRDENAEQARAIYEEIVRRQQDPALLTLRRPRAHAGPDLPDSARGDPEGRPAVHPAARPRGRRTPPAVRHQARAPAAAMQRRAPQDQSRSGHRPRRGELRHSLLAHPQLTTTSDQRAV